ncbi:MAG: hypothetical protein PHV51_05345 [Methanosarcinaceae archaeon]|nr:hypothetical protein [Methanosarcinaceae archaeon]
MVNRTLSEEVVNPGDTFSIKLEISARERVYAPAITEKLPEGWTSVPVKKAGALFKASTNEWIWLGGLGPGEERVLVYEVQVPQNSLPGVYTLKGRFSAGRGSESGGFVGPLEIGGACKIEVESGDITPVDSSAESRVSSDRSKGFQPEKIRLNQSHLFKLDSGPLNKETEIYRIEAGTDISESSAGGAGSENNSTEGVTTPCFSCFSSMISLLISLLILKTNYRKIL